MHAPTGPANEGCKPFTIHPATKACPYIYIYIYVLPHKDRVTHPRRRASETDVHVAEKRTWAQANISNNYSAVPVPPQSHSQMLARLLVAATALLQLTSAQILGSDRQGEYVDPATVPELNFDIDYVVVGKPHSGVLEIFNGEEIALNYTFANGEEEEIHIVGVGGSFADPTSGAVIANITDAKVGPITLQPGDVGTFNQRIGVNIPAGNYLLTPGLYVVKGSSLAMLGAQTVLAIVDEPPISLFSPQLILLEILLVATLAIGAWFFYVNFGASCLKTASATATAPGKATTKAKTSPASTVDESWLPDHLKKANKKKTT